MIHDLDLILSLVKSEVEQIEAFGAAVLSETEDIVNARLTFKNGTVANVTASRVSPEPMRKIRAFYRDSYASMDYGSHSGKVCRKSAQGSESETVELNEKNALGEELENFISCVAETMENGGKGVKQPKVSGKDGLKALELAKKITDAVQAHQKKYFNS
jgi:predicted dehydrogenase